MKHILITLSIVFSTILISKAQIAPVAEDISPLLIGEKIPEAILLDKNNQKVSILELIKTKPTILVFYRGGWCPYCNTHLSALANKEEEILKLGYQILAVSPENFENIEKTTNDNSINYTILSDPEGQFIQQMGLAFKPNSKTITYMQAKTKGTLVEVLPVPAIMILNKDAEIVFEYINPTYKKRMSEELLLNILKTKLL